MSAREDNKALIMRLDDVLDTLRFVDKHLEPRIANDPRREMLGRSFHLLLDLYNYLLSDADIEADMANTQAILDKFASMPMPLFHQSIPFIDDKGQP